MDFRKTDAYIDLSGSWSFAYSDSTAKYHNVADLKQTGPGVCPCSVPGNLELDLAANGIIEDPFPGMNIASLMKYEKSHIWYFREFRVESPPPCDAELVFEGIDCFADVYLNGEKLGATDNMLIEHVFDVTGRLREDNELLIHIRPAVEEAKRFSYPPSVAALCDTLEGLYVRKAPHMYGWDIMPRAVSAGIWRPVRLRFKPRERLESVFLQTSRISEARDYADMALHYRARTSAQPEDHYEIEIAGSCGDSKFEARMPAREIGGTLRFGLENPRMWWVRGKGEPNLYDVTVRLIKNRVEIDRATFTHGIRQIELVRTSTTDAEGTGEFCFRLNGEKVFVLGTNWVPLDAYHSRDPLHTARTLDLVEDIGCNMVRCWGGNVYESDEFFDICDRKGILVWQDFAMACSYPPQDEEHCKRLEREARAVVRRLRQHACLALWSGDNENDCGLAYAGRNPNDNILTRNVLLGVIREEDWTTPYIPSSPYIDEEAFKSGGRLPEDHLWGPRDYYKGDFYKNACCHFASEMGYHGCPSPESIRKFISPDKLWPYQDNDEWRLHSTDPIPGVDNFGYRVELMAKQIEVLFGRIPDNLEEFSFASQCSQAEALKFFIEMFRTGKWRRTGLIWWNIRDGWPQFSDAIVDYYYQPKLAYEFVKRCQQPLLLALREPANGVQELVACNDTGDDIAVSYTVSDIDTGEVLAGKGMAMADAATVVDSIPASSSRRFYRIVWNAAHVAGVNHYLAGDPPFELEKYRQWLSSDSPG